MFHIDPLTCPLLTEAREAAAEKPFGAGLPLELRMVAEIVKLRRIAADAVAGLRVCADMACGERPYNEDAVREAVETANAIESDWIFGSVLEASNDRAAFFADDLEPAWSVSGW